MVPQRTSFPITNKRSLFVLLYNDIHQVCSFLRGQELFGYVDGSYVCPPSHMAGKDGEQDVVNPTYIRWIKQDQLIMNLIISSLSEETIPIVIGLPTTKYIWDALEAAFSLPSNTQILNLYMQLQNLKQEDLSVTQYLHKVKLLIDELAAAGRPVCLPDQNIYMFKGLQSEFKDILTALFARQEPVIFSELHNLLLSHEFIHGQALSSLSISPSIMSDLPVNPSANLNQRASQNESQYNQQNHRGQGRNNKRGIGGNRGGRHDYRNNSSTENQWSSLDSRSCCQICNGVNHLAPNCFQRYNHTINPSAYLTHQSPHIAP